MSSHAAQLRRTLVVILACIPLVAVVAKAAWLQVGAAGRMREMAEDQYLDELTLSAPRGNMLDRTGRPLAVSVKVPSIYAEPRRVKDPVAAARVLGSILKVPVATLQKKLQSRRGFVWLQRRVTPAVAEQVAAAGVEGVAQTSESKRFYPNRELGAHVLGYTNVDGDGLDGLERMLDDRLAGRKMTVDGFRDARGGRLLLGEFAPTEMLVGDEVTLTLDSQIQYITEQALARAVLKHGAQAGFAIVMDPQTGAVLALANQPTFNPNDYARTSLNARRNRAVVDAFEPGSTMKVMLLATALHQKAAVLTERIFCENGVFAVGRHRIRDTHKAQWLTVEEVLVHSSNIGALKLGMRLGRGRWGDALHAFGFGQRTGVRLPGETPGILRPAERWSDAALATISFGQGISVNGMQLVAAVAAVANGGVLMQPHMVARIRAADGRALETVEPRVVRQVVDSDAAAQTLHAMEGVTRSDGTAPAGAVPGVVVAGKTGTAQKVDPGTRGYGEGRIASFVGVAPSRRPRLVILVVVDEPQDSPYGGVVAAPAFREIAMGALPLMGVSVQAPPDEVEAESEAPPPAVLSEEVLAQARALAARLAQDDAPVQDGIDEGLDPQPQGGAVPDLMGMNARVAVRQALRAGLEPVLAGSGVVVRQRPRAGVPLGEQRALRLKLAPAGEGG